MNLERMGPMMQAAVSLTTLLAFFLMILALFVMSYRGVDFPPGVKETLLIMVGVLASNYKEVMGFWLGSSLGSSLKNSLMPKA